MFEKKNDNFTKDSEIKRILPNDHRKIANSTTKNLKTMQNLSQDCEKTSWNDRERTQISSNDNENKCAKESQKNVNFVTKSRTHVNFARKMQISLKDKAKNVISIK